ncbi:2Fe-2S iron-sulfur cluster-binding protein [Pelagibaculum spongiae]|uniref:NADH-quinone oxidoreductase subunit G n=1 Tax=Pelagibaculum spongiae TaxID=2080658 RepID=A0A2V1GTM5_9GAMM|nr:2Fe-2S iron-sulfur cluster-binding protein [Pelagibaculum spongiae]PVZ65422.1 NADP oxidoreductase [Pelagibaculum spongiae]
MSNSNTILIDGQEVPFEPGETVLAAAKKADVYIPHLCFHPEVTVHGSCKLCTVKINGRCVSSCLTKASSGMAVENSSEEILDLRKQLIELLFAEGNHYCPTCELSGNCQLQALAYEFGITHTRFPLQYPIREMDATHPDIILDRDRCINCSLCRRASAQVDKKDVFSLAGRGPETYLQVHSSDGTLGQSKLTVDDLAANICPVGALFHKKNNYSQRPGQRIYDNQSIGEVGNQRLERVKEGENHG